MFKKMKSLLWPAKPKSQPEEPIDTPGPESDSEPEPVPPPLAATIEVPWDIAMRPKNFKDMVNKIHAELKDFLYEAKIKEIRAISAADKMQELCDEYIKKLKEAHGIPPEIQYDFIFPDGPGRPGYLKKKETK